MKKTNKLAKTLGKVSASMAKKSCGAASVWGICQPKMPKK